MIDKGGIVKRGYNEIAKEYHANRDVFDNTEELEEFASLLPKNAKVLDVGCGAGVPVTEFLVGSGFDVTGVDFSKAMLELARRNVPGATLIEEDMTELDFKDNTFDGLTAVYSIIHVPREKHLPLFQSFHKILKPNGIMLVSMGSDEWEAIDEFFGTDMFWSHYSAGKSLQLVKDSGFDIIYDTFLVRGGERHYWILAKNRK